MLVAFQARAASRPAEEQAGIDWLLDQIINSKATFIRNGAERYDAAKAVSPPEDEADVCRAPRADRPPRHRRRGLPPEETGKNYEIRLPDGKQGPMATWLMERLAIYANRERPNSTSSRPAV